MKLSELIPCLSVASPSFCKELSTKALTELGARRSKMSRDFMEEQVYHPWYWHEGDLWLNEDVATDIPLIVTGDLIISGICVDYGGPLLVLGTMRCEHMVSEWSICVWRDLICGGLCYQYYNDHVLEVHGALSARVFISDEKHVEAKEWKVDIDYTSYENSTSEQLATYRALGCKPDFFDEDELDEDELDELDGLDKLPILGSENADSLLKEWRTEGRNVFVEPLSPFTDLVLRWGESWAWRKRLWNPDRPTHMLSAEERTTLAAKGIDWLFELIVSKNMPSNTLAELAEHPEPRIRWAVASSPDCPKSCLKLLAKDTEPSVRAAVARRQDCSPAFRLTFAMDPDWTVRVATLFGSHENADHNLDEAVLIQLAKDVEPRVRCAVATVPKLPRSLVDKLSRDPDSAVVKCVSCFQPPDISALERQAEDPNPEMRIAVAIHVSQRKAPFDEVENRAAAQRILEKLLLDPEPAIRKKVVSGWLPHPSDVSIFQRLAEDSDPEVRMVVVGHISQGKAPFDRSENRATAQRILRKLMFDPHLSIRESVVENEELPFLFFEEHAEILVQDDDENIRRIFAEITRQAHILNLLADDKSSKVRKAVAENPNTSPETLTAIASKISIPIPGYSTDAPDHIALAEKLSNNPRLPSKAIEILLQKVLELDEIECDFFDMQPNLSPEQIIECLKFDEDDEDKEEIEAYQKCRSFFPRMMVEDRMKETEQEKEGEETVGRIVTLLRQRKAKAAAKELLEEKGGLIEPNIAAIEALFEHMLTCGVESLFKEAVRNVHCPPKALSEAVQRYLAHFKEDDKGGVEGVIADIAANPALPVEARKVLIKHLKQEKDDPVCYGLCHNPILTKLERRDLATNAVSSEDRKYLERALWIWCGETISEHV
jgi:hypothetical protein